MTAAPDPRAVVDAAAGLLSYPVLVGAGALADLGTHVRGRVAADRWVVIADATVALHHAGGVLAALGDTGGRAPLLLRVPPGESQKTRDSWTALTDRMLAAGCGRDTAVVALGGGVVGDLAGFVAATYMRGLPFVQVPTTLLAMVDASVGGKVAVDTPAGKNLVGAFHPPALVIADPSVLGTLDAVDLRAGAVEALKHGVIASPAHFEAAAALLARVPDSAAGSSADMALDLAAFVASSVRIKAEVVADDPHEHGRRRVLNCGHTVGHAVELLSGYALRHGEAVGIGMVVEARAAEALGVTAAGTADRIADALAAGGLPTAPPPGTDPEAVLAAARLDKKTRAGAIEYAVPRAIGTMVDAGGRWAVPLPDALVRTALRSEPGLRGTTPARAA